MSGCHEEQVGAEMDTMGNPGGQGEGWPDMGYKD